MCRRGLKEFLGVTAGQFGLGETGEHPRQLDDTRAVVEHRYTAVRDSTRLRLFHEQMTVGVRRHLRQMRHDDDLRGRGKLSQSSTHLDSGTTADTRVDLVEDE